MTEGGLSPVGGGMYWYHGYLIAGSRGEWRIQQVRREGDLIIPGTVEGPYKTRTAVRAEIDRRELLRGRHTGGASPPPGSSP